MDTTHRFNEIQHPRWFESLGLGPMTRLWLGGHLGAARKLLELGVKGLPRPATGPIDIAMIPPVSVDEAVYFASKLASRLGSAGGVWIVVRDKNQYASDDSSMIDDQQLLQAMGGSGFEPRGGTVDLSAGLKAVGFELQQPMGDGDSALRSKT